jgi:hypothetical protein
MPTTTVISSVVKVGRSRKDRLLPNGFPRWVRIYDNGGVDKKGGSVDRYTCVFTHCAAKTGGEVSYVGMSGAPFHPQGVCQHGSHHERIDRPRYRHLGHPIRFVDLPEDCQIVVLHDYLDLWDLVPEGNSAMTMAQRMVNARMRSAESVPY